jgi:hypothetical protein
MTLDELNLALLAADAHASAMRTALKNAKRGSDNYRFALQAVKSAEDAETNLQQQAAVMFGERYGWKVSKVYFDLLQLAKGKCNSGSRDYLGIVANPSKHHDQFDHAYYYKTPGRHGRPAAIVAHLYNYPANKADCDDVAARYGLRYEHISDFPSWWYTGVTKLVLWTADKRS